MSEDIVARLRDKMAKNNYGQDTKIHSPKPNFYSYHSSDNAIVVAEIPVTNFELHNIATGKLCQLGFRGETFAVRFLTKSSQKVKNSNRVLRQMVIQVVAVGKQNAMRKEHIATDIKIQTVKSKKKTVKKVQPQFNKTKTQEELF